MKLDELRLVAWQATQACNLACVHCRADAQVCRNPNELTTEEVFKLVDQIAEFSSPILIISGGEPLLREDVIEVAKYAVSRGLRPVMSPNGTLLTPEICRAIKNAGVSRISVSLDGSDAARNDSFRMVEGAFEAATRGLRYAREAGLPFQINTTVTRRNVNDLPHMLNTVIRLGAVTWDVFMLVPTGRGRLEDEVTPEQYEAVLNWLWEVSLSAPIPIKVTCGPHYQRIIRQRGAEAKRRSSDTAGTSLEVQVRSGPHPSSVGRQSRGCMAGNGFCLVTDTGEVYPCGYLPVSAGNVRRQHFREIYERSPLFLTLRDPTKLGGKCGRCEYKNVCYGCRARAYSAFGDYMYEEPFCVYQPGQSLATKDFKRAR